jgi:hypothetical protein
VIGAGCVALMAPAACASSSDSAKRAKCMLVVLGKHRECLAVGKACNVRYQRTYESYGLVCKRDRHGRYRLRTRVFHSPPAV